MVTIAICGRVVSDIHESNTVTDVRRVFFTVESRDETSLPLQYQVVAFGNIASRVLAEIAPGAQVFCAGRLSAGGPQRKVSVALSGFEVLKGAPANVAE